MVMVIEEHYGNKIVCQHIFPGTEIKIGSRWQGSSGSVVEVVDIKRWDWTFQGKTQLDYDVYYKWLEGGIEKVNYKDSFNFQCRYCLIVEDK